MQSRLLCWSGLLTGMACAAVMAGAPDQTSTRTEPVPLVVPGASFPLERCQLQHPDRLYSVEADCGSLEVAENPDLPDGSSIHLKIAVIPAVNREGPPDPLFFLTGGPGQAATEFFPAVSGAFSRIQRKRDIVLIDQRGTGSSNRLRCDFPDDAVVEQMAAEEIKALTRKCLDSLKGDPVYYTTSVAVRDLDQVRAALGYESINLYGISYGTRVAQHYLRRYPDRVRSVILDGVVPPGQVLGVDTALHAQHAIDTIFERCRNTSACKSAFGDPAADFVRLRELLGKSVARVSFPDPLTGVLHHSDVRPADLQVAVRMMSYSASQAALLPLVLHEGAVRGNLAPLAAQSRMIQTQLSEDLSIGMHNAVVCTEDAPFFSSVPADREALRKSYMGESQLDLLTHMCSVWPRGTLDEDFHQPLNAGTPALLLSGAVDPVTPPAYAEQALQGLKSGIHVVLDGQGHGQLGTGCIPQLMAKFIDQARATDLDVSCTREVSPEPFFTSFSGPPP